MTTRHYQLLFVSSETWTIAALNLTEPMTWPEIQEWCLRTLKQPRSVSYTENPRDMLLGMDEINAPDLMVRSRAMWVRLNCCVILPVDGGDPDDAIEQIGIDHVSKLCPDCMSKRSETEAFERSLPAAYCEP